MIDMFAGENRFLSNFWPARVWLPEDGKAYATVEHAYQAAKTEDLTERRAVREAATAGQAKRAGRKLTVRPDWETVKQGVMLDLLRQKFAIPGLRKLLLATGDQELVEGNYWGDRYWGVCDGKGQNHLGRLLMQVRQEISE